MIKFEEINMPDGRKALVHMDELNCSIRFVARGPKMVRETNGDFSPVTTPVTIAEVIDKTTGEVYASCEGDNEQAATVGALTTARTATKPLTPAQKADPMLKAKDEELKQLREKVVALEAAAESKSKKTKPAE